MSENQDHDLLARIDERVKTLSEVMHNYITSDNKRHTDSESVIETLVQYKSRITGGLILLGICEPIFVGLVLYYLTQHLTKR